jgi:hypothetical protein
MWISAQAKRMNTLQERACSRFGGESKTCGSDVPAIAGKRGSTTVTG